MPTTAKTAGGGAKIVFGGGAFMSPLRNTAPTARPLMDCLRDQTGGLIRTIDSAANYAGSEVVLGELKAGRSPDGDGGYGFDIDTKISGGLGAEPCTAEVAVAMGRESLRRLGLAQVDVLYLHAPDRRVPLSDTLRGIDVLYHEGAFQRFGLSNFLGPDVEAVLAICEAENYAWRPSVYQANYSAVARRFETELLPLLRKHGMAIYAYSPVAGGFLTKTVAELAPLAETAGPDGQELTTMGVPPAQGRWHPNHPLGKMYRILYAEKPAILEGLAEWNRIAADEGVGAAELAYRWVCHNSVLDGEKGDALVIGARNEEQTLEVIGWVARGPVSEDAVRRIDGIWESIKEEAPLDNVTDYLSKTKVGG